MKNNIDQLIQLVKFLKSPDGCPWDREQTSKSLIRYMTEEMYEVIEAIEDNKPKLLKEELGDLLLHIVFQSLLAEDKKQFDFHQVIQNVINKLEKRHLHILYPDKYDEPDDSYEQQKMAEKNRDSVLEGIPRSLSALTKAQRLQDKASGVGFDWRDLKPILNKMHEEIHELEDALKLKDSKNIKEEIGDVLFTVVNIARFLNLDSEAMLRQANRKFEKRFKAVERKVQSQKINMKNLRLDELDEIWEQVKESE